MRLGLAVAIVAALAAGASVLAVEAQRALRADSFGWRIDAGWFGGFSGLEIAPDGSAMTVISDRGIRLEAEIARDGSGEITAVMAGRPRQILSSKSGAMPGHVGDSEGLALAPDGVAFISFEGVPRVARYAAPDARSEVLPRPKAFRDLEGNGAFEALAIDPQGRLYTLPEAGWDARGDIPVFRWDGARWEQPFSLVQRGRFRPVGADFGPDGRFYLLERATGLLGFRSRIRRWEITPEGIGNEETLLTTDWGRHDNLEGLAIWRDARGGLRATMISDDNFLALQRTEIVEYALPE